MAWASVPAEHCLPCRVLESEIREVMEMSESLVMLSIVGLQGS